MYVKFDENIDSEIEEQKEKIKKNIEQLRKIQNEVNRLENLKAYQSYMQDDVFSKRVNPLMEKALPYSDRAETNPSSLKNRFGQIVFETAMFDFIDKHENFEKIKQYIIESPNKKSDKPDFIFKENNQEYYLECTTNTSSLFDKFVGLVLRFDMYKKAATFLYKHFKKTQESCDNRKDKKWYCSIESIVHELSSEQKNDFISLTFLSEDVCNKDRKNVLEAIRRFESDTHIIRYACYYYKDLIPDEILIELEEIEFSFNLGAGNDQYYDAIMKERLIISIARNIVDKAKKCYFKKGKPVTLAISFSLNKQMELHGIARTQLIPHLQENLMSYVQAELSDKKYDEDRNGIIEAIKHLYAIIIDTTLSNWFPDIAKERYGATFKDENENCYICLYNQNHPLVQAESRIFTKINLEYVHMICL